MKLNLTKDNGKVRKFNTGATRDTATNKHDYEGFFSPLVMVRYAEYMTKNRTQSDGTIRDSDNWQKGIPLSVYMKSNFRHFMDMWMGHRGLLDKEALIEGICGIMFNTMGYLHELLKGGK